jgi:exonuclease SbcC
MRPIKLTISAFGPYATQQVIDFEELNGRNIFVISGKTGAGKTTIFDAISYALYGEASGESRETDSLRSHFAPDSVETFVELEFELRGETYIVNRVPKQKKKKVKGEGYTEKSADATLTLPNGAVITKVTNVTNKLVEILGITRDQFKQIVMLPQGEFKKLLLADSLERESIFRKIFNTYDFEKIQSQLKDKAIELNKKRNKSKEKMQTNLENIKGVHDILLGEYVDFPLVIEELKNLIDKNSESYKLLNEELKNVECNLENLNTQKNKIENNNSLIKEKEDSLKKVEELLSKKEEFEIKKKEIRNAKSAKEVKYIEDKLIENKQKLSKREENYKLSLSNLDKLKADFKIASEILKSEEAKESEREKLAIQIDNLKNIEPKIAEFDKLKQIVISITKNIEEVKLQVLDNKKLTENLKIEKLNNETILKDIASFETRKVELENEINNKNKIIEDIRNLFKVIASHEKYKAKHFELSKDYEGFEKEYLTVKDEYETMDDLYKKEQAGILASKLESNKPCPVCGSTNHPNPATIKNDANIPTREELKIVKANLDKLEEKKNSKIRDLTALNSDIKNSLEFVNSSLSRFADSLNLDTKYSQSTYNDVKNKGTELKSVIENLQKELLSVKGKVELKEGIVKKITDINISIEANENKLISLESKEKDDFKHFTEVSTKIEEYKKDIPKNIESVKVLNDLINEKNKVLNESKQRLLILRESRDAISKNLEGETSTSKEINNSIEELILEIEKINLQFEVLMKKEGFDTLKQYQNAKLNIDKIEIIQNQVEDYNAKLNFEATKKEELINKCKGLEFMDLLNIEEQIKVINVSKKEMEAKLKDKYSILDSNKDILKNVENLNVEFKEKEEEYRVVGELADLANGKKSPYISFERYILASYFEDIIDAANIRLEKMTGDRFSLIRKKSKSKGAGQKGLELEIYDNYTDSSRDVSSLSGGESFKASLSLALGLSDVVQSNAGGVSLDTMFVDEGFGTLDPQSLDSAIDSLLELQRGGRLVGIISHVEELKERVEAKLEVTATSRGSKARFNIL